MDGDISLKKGYSKQGFPASERRLQAPLLPVMSGLFGLFYILTGFRGWLVFLIGSLGAWLFAFIWARALERGLNIERKIHLAWAQVGDSVPEEIIIKNKSRLPAVWVEIIDESDSLTDPVRLVSDVEALSSRRRHPMHQFNWRGLYSLGPTRLQTGDPLGIYSLTLHDGHSSSILITPPQLALPWLRIAPGSKAGERQRHFQSLERGISDAGVREYTPGDSLRRIHWRASAHSDSLIVRQLDSTTSRDWWIFVDLGASAQAGAGQDTTVELSVVLAASLIGRGYRERRRVGLALAGPGLVWLEPHSGPTHRWQMLRALSMAAPGEWPLAKLLSLRHSGQAAGLIIITPSTEPSWVAAAGGNRKVAGLTTLLVDPREFGGGGDQSQVTAALIQQGIPYTRIPKVLLDEAYAPSSQDSRKHPGNQISERFLEDRTSAWQRMD